MAAKKKAVTPNPEIADAYSGQNPHVEGTALWASWENHKREARGLAPTNNFDGPDTVKMIQKHGAYVEVDYKNSK